MAGRAVMADDASMDTTMTDEPSLPPPPPRSSAPPPRPGRRFTRSRDDRVLGGVAGGLAHTYGWDAGIVRVVVAVAAVVTGGAVAVAYGIAWLVVPEESTGLTGAETFRGRRMRHARENWALPVGVLLVAAGMLGVAHRFAWRPFSNLFWPITLIGGGLAVLLVRHRDPALTDGSAEHPDDAVHDNALVTTPPTADPTSSPAASLATVTTAEQPTVPAYAGHAPWPTGTPTPPVAPRAPRERSMLGRLTWSALLLLAGGAALLSTTDAVDVDAGFVIALALVLVGIALVVGTWYGRSRGLIALALVLVLLASATAALDIPLRGGIGEEIHRVEDARNMQQKYELAIGHLVIDLRNVTSADRTLHFSARDTIGQLEIVLPTDAAVDIRTRVGAGDAQVLDQPDASGWRVDQRLRIAGTGPHFVIDARVGFGQIVVRQEQASPAVTNLGAVRAPGGAKAPAAMGVRSTRMAEATSGGGVA